MRDRRSESSTVRLKRFENDEIGDCTGNALKWMKQFLFCMMFMAGASYLYMLQRTKGN